MLLNVHMKYLLCNWVLQAFNVLRMLFVSDLYEVTEGNEKAIYWRVAYPFPMSHRDVSLCNSVSPLYSV